MICLPNIGSSANSPRQPPEHDSLFPAGCQTGNGTTMKQGASPSGCGSLRDRSVARSLVSAPRNSCVGRPSVMFSVESALATLADSCKLLRQSKNRIILLLTCGIPDFELGFVTLFDPAIRRLGGTSERGRSSSLFFRNELCDDIGFTASAVKPRKLNPCVFV